MKANNNHSINTDLLDLKIDFILKSVFAKAPLFLVRAD